jgi:hypothetical protein
VQNKLEAQESEGDRGLRKGLKERHINQDHNERQRDELRKRSAMVADEL